jgi:hypothetical protein
MRTNLLIWLTVTVLLWFSGWSVSGAPASQPTSGIAATRPSDSEIRQSVRFLNHPSPARRREAIRKLAGWGRLAFPELKRAANDRNHEVALAARELLEELEAAILIGARVRLEVSRSPVSWDEPFDLILHVDNCSNAEMRVPWPKPTTQPADPDAAQVAAMLDVADFLDVVGKDGEVIDLRVDAIEHNAEVYAAVNVRAGEDPPTHVVPANQSVELVIPSFNRGWARYPLLEEQTYTIRFRYQPAWKNLTWVEDGFGLITSDPVRIEVTQAAPDRIRMARRPVALHLAEEGQRLEVRIENTWDRPQWINTNVGRNLRQGATLQWRWDKGGLFPEKHRLDIGAIKDSAPFDPQHVRKVKPGETIIIQSFALDKLQQQAEAAVPEDYETYGLSVRYTSMQTPGRIRAGLNGEDLDRTDHIRGPMFVGVAESNSVRVTRGASSDPSEN